MKRTLQSLVLGTSLSLTLGCSVEDKPDSFIFTPDLPPDFKYQALAIYVPAAGETCTVPGGRNTHIRFNREDKEYKPSVEIVLYRTVNGCPLMLRLVEITITGIYGKKRGDSSYHYARFSVKPELPVLPGSWSKLYAVNGML